MIIVSKPSKSFTYTAKNTARRQAIINDYEEEINQVYDDVRDSAQTNISAPKEWTTQSTYSLVHSVVHQVLKGRTMGDDDDLFENGCDRYALISVIEPLKTDCYSLQATWIRNTLLRGLRETAKLDTRGITENFVYSYPTITSLSNYVFSLASGGHDGTSTSDKIVEMKAMVSKYTSDLYVTGLEGINTPIPVLGSSSIVVLVGSTGAVGSHTLAVLLKDQSVAHIYALNRRNASSSLHERQASTFKERGLSTELLASDKLTLLEIDSTAPQLGLDAPTYGEVLSFTHSKTVILRSLIDPR